MATLRKIKGLDKSTFAMISGIATAVTTYVTLTFGNVPLTVLAVSIVNIFVVWLGVESGHEKPNRNSKAP